MQKTKIVLASAALLALFQPAAFAAPAIPTPVGFDPATGSGWLAGAVAGYNWQRGSFVFGLEGDISGMNLRSETTGTFTTKVPGFVPPSGDAIAGIDWYGTVRARLGWAVGSFLFYGTGGLAYGNVRLTNNYNLGSIGGGLIPTSLNAQTSATRAGWVAGAGVEYLLNRNLTLNVQYQYVDLGSVSLAAVAAPSPFQALTGPSASTHAQFQAVTVGLNWRFDVPPGVSSADASMTYKAAPALPPSDPWQGLYVGGRAGGAWGNKLNVTPPNVVGVPL